ncbi:hypothetical protein Tco_0833993 [Tanacetum coccineum]
METKYSYPHLQGDYSKLATRAYRKYANEPPVGNNWYLFDRDTHPIGENGCAHSTDFGNFTYIVDFMITEDISSIIDPRLSQVVLGKPFVEISNMTHDPPEGVVRFTNRNNEVAYKIPHKIEQYDSLSNLEKEHTKPVYLRNEEDKRGGVEYVMSKILGFFKECLELKPEYLTGMDDEGEVT